MIHTFSGALLYNKLCEDRSPLNLPNFSPSGLGTGYCNFLDSPSTPGTSSSSILNTNAPLILQDSAAQAAKIWTCYHLTLSYPLDYNSIMRLKNFSFRNKQMRISVKLALYTRCVVVAKSCLTLHELLDFSTPGFSVLQNLLDFSHPWVNFPSPLHLNLLSLNWRQYNCEDQLLSNSEWYLEQKKILNKYQLLLC